MSIDSVYRCRTCGTQIGSPPARWCRPCVPRHLHRLRGIKDLVLDVMEVMEGGRWPPTIREVAIIIERAVAPTYGAILQLEDEGMLEREPGISRSVRLSRSELQQRAQVLLGDVPEPGVPSGTTMVLRDRGWLVFMIDGADWG